MKKGKSYIAGLIILVALYVFTAFVSPDAFISVSNIIVLAIAGTTVGYQGINVADNAMKGKYYRPELDKSPCKGEDR
jgi:hypothetical protein